METTPSLTRKFITGELYYRVSSLASKGFGIFTTLFVVTSLSLYEYGVFQLLLSIAGFASVPLYLGGIAVSNDLHRLIAKGEESKAKKLFIEYSLLRLFLAGSITTIIVVAAPFLQTWYQPDFILFIQIVGIYVGVEGVSSVLLMLVQTRLDFRSAALEATYGKIAHLVFLCIVFLAISIGTREALIAGLVGNVVSAMSLIPSSLRSWRMWKLVEKERAPVLMGVFKGYGKWEALRQLFSKVVSNVQPWLIKVFISTEAVAVYSVALTLVDVAKSVLNLDTFASIVPRRLGNPQLSRKTFVMSIKYMFWSRLGIALISLVSVPILVHLFVPHYITSMQYFYALLLTLPLLVFVMQAEVFLVALREQKFLFAASFSRNVATPALLILTLPFFGLWGAVGTKLIVTISLLIAEFRYLFLRHPNYRFALRELYIFDAEDANMLKKFFEEFFNLLKIKFHSILK